MNAHTLGRVGLLVLLFGSVACGPTSYSTEFDLTESPISESASWHHVGLDWAQVVTANGMAFGTQTGSGGFDDSYAYLVNFTQDHSASGVVHIEPGINTATTHEVEILLRWADTEHTARGYECNFAYDGQYAQIVRWNGAKGDFTPLQNAPLPGGLHEGDTVSASIVGNLITTYVNGVQLSTITDNTFPNGQPGMGFWRGAPSSPQNDVAFLSFAARDIVPTPM
jgi:hypothetical protein